MNLPFTNIRQVLSLHNKVSPEKIFLTVISDKGREELSYAEFSARCHQTANFLQEDLGIKPGDVVVIQDDHPADEAVLFMASWLVGAVATSRNTEGEKQQGHLKAYFIRDTNGSFKHFAEHPTHKGLPLIQLGGTPVEGYLHFDTLVRGMPNSFFNDYPEPDLESPAFRSLYSTMTITQGELLATAQRISTSQAITGNQRLSTYLPLSGEFQSEDISVALFSFITTVLVGGSLVVDTEFRLPNDPDYQLDFWRVIAAERLHIACLSFGQLAEIIGYALAQKKLGKPIYGEGVYQQDIKQLRHIYCPDAKGKDDLIKQFTDMFPVSGGDKQLGVTIITMLDFEAASAGLSAS